MKKIHTRSPYYLTSSDAPAPTPILPTEYIDVDCADVSLVSEFAGIKVYTLAVGPDTGDIDIVYAGGNVPIKITLDWDGNTITTNYVGLNAYDSDLINAGVSISEIATASVSTKNGTISIEKDAIEPQIATITVESPLTNDNYSLTFNCPNVAPPAPTCPDRALVFQVCNSNSVRDDNFNVYLNDNYIGYLDLSTNAQVGSVFIASLDTGLNITAPDFGCPLALMDTYRFDPAFVQYGNNVLELRNDQNNGTGNYGIIGIRNYELSGSNLINPCTVNNLTFSGGSGTSFTFNFSYTECCPTDIT